MELEFRIRNIYIQMHKFTHIYNFGKYNLSIYWKDVHGENKCNNNNESLSIKILI